MFYVRRFKSILKWLFFDGKWIFSLPFLLLLIPFFVHFQTYLFNIDGVDVLFGAGLLLRLIGFIIIILGVNSKLTKYTDGGIVGLFKRWWEKGPWKPTIINLPTARTTASANSISFEIVGDTDKMTTDEKVKYLIDQFNQLKKQVANSEKNIQENKKELLSKINKLEKQIWDRIDLLEDRVKVSFIGNIEKELFGAFSIFMGVIYSSIPGSVLYITSQIMNIF